MKLILFVAVTVCGIGVAGAASLPPSCYGPPNAPPPPSCLPGLSTLGHQSYTPKVLWYRPSTKNPSGRPVRKQQH